MYTFCLFVVISTLYMSDSRAASAEAIKYEVHRGPISRQHRIELTPLRSKLFHDFPYLYCSNPEREEMVWDKLSKDSTILLLAYTSERLVGAVIALGMSDDDAKFLRKHPAYKKDAWLEIDMAMVVKDCQRQGIIRTLLEQLKHEAKASGYTDLYGITVVRSDKHPLKPENFIDLYKVWSSMGGTPTGITAVWNWPTRCGTVGNESIAPIDNMIEYWHYTLSPQEQKD